MQVTDTQTTTNATDELARDLYALVVYTHKHCNSDLFEAVGQLELSLSQIKLLHHLEHAKAPITLKDAAEFVRVSLPAASRLVDDLVRRGLVARAEDSEDRRMKRLTSTEAGLAATRRLNAARLNGLKQFAQTLNDTEREAVQHALAILIERPDFAACRPEEA
ncbi:MAG: MarR family winged helix-turn-helix transcriptional regulator [Solirubrobacteraceae bacterium]